MLGLPGPFPGAIGGGANRGAEQDPDEAELAGGAGPRKRSRKAAGEPKAPKEYIPRIGTANYAFLIVLLEVGGTECAGSCDSWVQKDLQTLLPTCQPAACAEDGGVVGSALRLQVEFCPAPAATAPLLHPGRSLPSCFHSRSFPCAGAEGAQQEGVSDQAGADGQSGG